MKYAMSLKFYENILVVFKFRYLTFLTSKTYKNLMAKFVILPEWYW